MLHVRVLHARKATSILTKQVHNLAETHQIGPASRCSTLIQILLPAQVEVAAEVHEGAPEQGEAVMSSMLTQLLTEASELLLAPGVLEGVGQILIELQSVGDLH